MEHQKNKGSNSFNLKNYFAISAFNAESSHKITVKINQKKIFQKELTKNKEHQMKIEDYFDYTGPSINSIEIKWVGERDCEKKYLKIYKVIVNDQHLTPHSVMVTPTQNHYIENLLSTKEGTAFYKNKLFSPGHEHGWYGLYKFDFLLDRQNIKDKKQQSLIETTGIMQPHIYSDATKGKHYRKAVIR